MPRRQLLKLAFLDGKKSSRIETREFRMQELKMKLKTGTALLKEMESLKGISNIRLRLVERRISIATGDNRCTVSPLPALSRPIDRAGNTDCHRHKCVSGHYKNRERGH